MTPTVTAAPHPIPAGKLPGHWLLASLGKKVLRPGGIELTQRMLEALAVRSEDDVVEFAPGMGATARLLLGRAPRNYTAVERDEAAAAQMTKWLTPLGHRCILASAEATGLPAGCASAVCGEAMLTMQSGKQKLRILEEARRLLGPEGRYGIHELCLVDVDSSLRKEIERELSMDIHVGVQPLTVPEWRDLLECAGFHVAWEAFAPMHLLEPRRVLRDEGIAGVARIAYNLARKPEARKRVFRMRSMFRRYGRHMRAIALVAVKRSDA